MSKALSLDLRERVVATIDQGVLCREAAARFGVSAASAIRWQALMRKQGPVRPSPLRSDTTVPILAKGKTDIGRIWTYVLDDAPFGGTFASREGAHHRYLSAIHRRRLKPRFLPAVQPTDFNYPVDIHAKWHGARYRFSPSAIARASKTTRATSSMLPSSAWTGQALTASTSSGMATPEPGSACTAVNHSPRL